MAVEAEWVAVDWGTSNLRVWGIGPGGEVVFARTSDQGMSRLQRDAYAGVLGDLLADQFAPSGRCIDILICGMAGARQGWLEAPYLDAPADLEELANYCEELPAVSLDRVLLMPQGTGAEELEARAAWLKPYCVERGLVFCPRKHIEWFGAVRGT